MDFSKLSHEECQNLATVSLSPDVIHDATTAGISWSVILTLILQYGPQALQLLLDLINKKKSS